MAGAKYRTILEENLLESAKDLRLGWSCSFQQDNEPKHPARATMERFRSKHVHMLEYFSLYMCIAGRDLAKKTCSYHCSKRWLYQVLTLGGQYFCTPHFVLYF